MAPKRQRFIRALLTTDWRVLICTLAVGIILGAFTVGSHELIDKLLFPSDDSPAESPDLFTPGPQPEPSTDDLVDGQIYKIERVVDGDTVRLAGYKNSIRLIGADTPEMFYPDGPPEPFAKEATEFAEKFFAAGKVRIKLDGPSRDKYGRYLAHLWVDDRELAVELVRNGLAEAMTGFPFSQSAKDRLTEAENQARAEGLGIWKESEGIEGSEGVRE